MSEEIKPCPFCNGNDLEIIQIDDSYFGEDYRIICKSIKHPRYNFIDRICCQGPDGFGVKAVKASQKVNGLKHAKIKWNSAYCWKELDKKDAEIKELVELLKRKPDHFEECFTPFSSIVDECCCDFKRVQEILAKHTEGKK